MTVMACCNAATDEQSLGEIRGGILVALCAEALYENRQRRHANDPPTLPVPTAPVPPDSASAGRIMPQLEGSRDLFQTNGSTAIGKPLCASTFGILHPGRCQEAASARYPCDSPPDCILTYHPAPPSPLAYLVGGFTQGRVQGQGVDVGDCQSVVTASRRDIAPGECATRRHCYGRATRRRLSRRARCSVDAPRLE